MSQSSHEIDLESLRSRKFGAHMKQTTFQAFLKIWSERSESNTMCVQRKDPKSDKSC